MDQQLIDDVSGIDLNQNIGVSSYKARKILRDGRVRGRKLTPKQRRYFGYVAGKGSRKRRRKSMGRGRKRRRSKRSTIGSDLGTCENCSKKEVKYKSIFDKRYICSQQCSDELWDEEADNRLLLDNIDDGNRELVSFVASYLHGLGESCKLNSMTMNTIDDDNNEVTVTIKSHDGILTYHRDF